MTKTDIDRHLGQVRQINGELGSVRIAMEKPDFSLNPSEIIAVRSMLTRLDLATLFLTTAVAETNRPWYKKFLKK